MVPNSEIEKKVKEARETRKLFIKAHQLTKKEDIETDIIPLLRDNILISLALWQFGFEEEIIKALEKNTSLTVLNFFKNAPGLKEIEAISEVLKRNKTWNELRFSGNKLGPEGAISIAKGLEGNMKLTLVGLSDNNIGPKGAEALAKVLERKDTTLRTITLGNNNLGSEGAAAIAAALKVNDVLTSVTFDNNNIGLDGVTAIAEALKVNGTLLSIDLATNNLGYGGAVAIAKALEENKTLTSFDLSGNKLNPEGAVAIATALEKNKTLTTMDLGDNNLGPEGVTAIAKSLEKNTILTDLIGEEVDDHPEIQRLLTRNREELVKRNQRIAIENTLKQHEKVGDIYSKMDPGIFHTVMGYSDLESEQSKWKIARQEQEMQRNVDPVSRMISFFTALSNAIQLVQDGTVIEENKKKIINQITEKMTAIQKDATAMGYVFNYGRGDNLDNQKILDAIKHFKNGLLAHVVGSVALTDYIDTIADTLQEEWVRIVQESTRVHPVDRIVDFIDRLTDKLTPMNTINAHRGAEIIRKINASMTNIREYNSLWRYRFKEADIKRIENAIRAFKTIDPNSTWDSRSQLYSDSLMVKYLREQCEIIRKESEAFKAPASPHSEAGNAVISLIAQWKAELQGNRDKEVVEGFISALKERSQDLEQFTCSEDIPDIHRALDALQKEYKEPSAEIIKITEAFSAAPKVIFHLGRSQ